MFARILAYVNRKSSHASGRQLRRRRGWRSKVARTPSTSYHSLICVSSIAKITPRRPSIQKKPSPTPPAVSTPSSRHFSTSPHDDFLTGSSGAYVEKMFAKWKEDPASVDSSWSTYFMSGDTYSPRSTGTSVAVAGGAPSGPFDLRSSAEGQKAVNDAVNLMKLVNAYQSMGHFLAKLDPLKILDQGVDRKQFVPEMLQIRHWGFTEADWDRPIFVGDHSKFLRLMKSDDGWVTLRKTVERLKEIYCGNIGYQYMHIANFPKNDYVRGLIEWQDWTFSKEEKIRILDRLIWATVFEEFLDIKYPAQKRFGVIGAESLVPLLKEVIDEGARTGIDEFVIGMPHRGRLITLTTVMRKPLERILHEFRGLALPWEQIGDSGDVKYHLGYSADRKTPDNINVHLSLMPNPSHLEAVNASVMGKARAKQFYKKDADRSRTCVILLHGDASFAGQGSVYESMALTDLPDYTTGGVIHLVVNNQIGFTTDTMAARSSPYCTDVARSIASPIFHVNGDDAESVARCAKMAVQYRQKFKADTVVDMLCFRRYGHNEGDEPAFTQPLMYKVINEKMKTNETVLNIYKKRLIDEGVVTENEFTAMSDRVEGLISDAFDAPVTDDDYIPDYLGMNWQHVSTHDGSMTGVSKDRLKLIGDCLGKFPENFQVHRNLKKILEKRVESVETGKGIDWGTAESLAYGSLLMEGIHVRLSGQDSERGTFSHRHAVLHDQANTDKSQRPQYRPLSNLPGGTQAEFHVMNSNLSELAVLGFEYGYSVEHPDALVLWEAQFGDFANGAQVVYDQFVSSAEAKWMRQSGLVCLLPHGYEGGGPEHSSARMERYLQMCNDDCDVFSSNMDSQLKEINWQIVNCSSPANFFHVLRRQVHRSFRKPLIVFTPKFGLRHPLASSSIEEMSDGTNFRCVIGEESPDMKKDGDVKRVVFVSGKLWIQLMDHRIKQGKSTSGYGNDVALVRLEQVSPFPYADVCAQMDRYKNAEIVWAQEEPKNMGACDYVRPRFHTALKERKDGRALKVLSRGSSASPATGYPQIHAREQSQLIETCFA